MYLDDFIAENNIAGEFNVIVTTAISYGMIKDMLIRILEPEDTIDYDMLALCICGEGEASEKACVLDDISGEYGANLDLYTKGLIGIDSDTFVTSLCKYVKSHGLPDEVFDNWDVHDTNWAGLIDGYLDFLLEELEKL